MCLRQARIALLGLGVSLLWALANWAAEEKKPAADAKPRFTNRLARETSPYLLLHAHNPVDWFPWGPEAFDKAKKEKKPIFLSIGYSSCYWCHVMERQSFANADIAKIMNEHFVCIKVDREERPDVDAIYMAALHAQGSQGGWPLSMFLTPDGKPIGGGTYWPPEDREVQGQRIRGFKTILGLVQDDWTNNREALLKHADRMADAVNQMLALANRKLLLTKLDRELVLEAVASVQESYDPLHGGFGAKDRGFRGPKFPTPPMAELLLTHYLQTKDATSLKILTHALDRMALGGIYDQVGGGFHRYSVDREWKVPHFEKMLYDNAQLVSLYSRAFQLTKKPLYRRVVEETLAFIEREMASPEGGFYSALDAESEAEEGKFYVWTAGEIEALLPKVNADLFKRVYGLDAGPNFEEKFNVLFLPRGLEELAKEMMTTEEELAAQLRPMRQKLFEARAKRARPLLDTKILTSWNGLMIAGYADAAMALEKPEHAQTARRAAEFVLAHLRTKDGRLLRTTGGGLPGQPPVPIAQGAKLNAYLEDYAFFVHGLLKLHDATGEKRWLDESIALTDKMIDLYQDKEAGGFFYTSHDHEKLFARTKDQHDGATPSGNSLAAMNLVRLHQKTGAEKYRLKAEETFKAFGAALKMSPDSMSTLVQALALYVDAPAKARQPANSGAPQEQAQKSESPVKVTASVTPEKPAADGKQVVTVTLDIEKGWHIYANPPGNDNAVPTVVQVSSKVKLEDVKVEYPKGKELKDAALDMKVSVYEGKVEIKAMIRRGTVNGQPDAGPLDVTVKYQACDDAKCLAPKTVRVGAGMAK
jgi:hypothetical protein